MENDTKFLSKRVGIILGSILFALCFIGITYAAYLTGQTYNDVNMASQVTPDLSYIEDKSMMIQGLLPTPKDIAIKAAESNGCYDKSDTPLPVCSLYEFTVTNTSSDELDQKVKFYLNIEENTYANYYYMVYEGEKEDIKEDIAPIIDSTHLPNNDLGKKYLSDLTTELEPTESKTYTILFYVNETGENQLYIDTNKVFTASVIAEPIVTGKYNHYKEELLNGSVPDIENTGLTPIVYNGEKWEVANPTTEWYNYSEQKWANAASLKEGVLKEPGTELDIENDAYAMFVWIPRFSYTIGCTDESTCLGYKIEGASDLATATPGAIDIKFVDTDTKEDPGIANGTYPTYTYTSDETRETEIANWYTHPAFDFGGETLSGIWVGKFETSVDTTSTCYTNLSTNSSSASSNCVASNTTVMPRILPNVLALTNQTVYNQFNTANKFTATDNIYGLTGDAHMMKNSEWSAVAYLSQSIYGKYGNASYTLTNKEIYKNDSGRYVSSTNWAGYTGRSYGQVSTESSQSSTNGTYKYDGTSTTSGATSCELCGTGASTTGNIYGIYDMSGGAYEYVMGNYGGNIGVAGFSSMPDTKYYDKFTTTSPFATKQADTIGYAFVEVSGWYSDGTSSSYSTSAPWVSRGSSFNSSSGAGAFCGYSLGLGAVSNVFSFRVCLATLP